MLVREDQRFIQTAIGWLMSDMSKVFPDVAQSFFEEHLKYIHKEVILRHTKYLKGRNRLIKRFNQLK